MRKPLSEETKRKIGLANSIALKGKKHSEETKKKIADAIRGKKKKPMSEKGRRNISKATMGRIQSAETRKKISESNIRLGRRPPSMLGIKMSEETKRKIGEANKGKIRKPITDKTRKKLSEARLGEKNHFFGKKHSEEARKKISEKKLANPIKYWLGKKRENISGEKSPHWKGGLSFEPYTVDWTNTLKRSIRERDNYTCQSCSVQQGDLAHDVHHIDYNKKNCNPENLITLCRSCHTKTGAKNRKEWQERLTKLINKNNI